MLEQKRKNIVFRLRQMDFSVLKKDTARVVYARILYITFHATNQYILVVFAHSCAFFIKKLCIFRFFGKC